MDTIPATAFEPDPAYNPFSWPLNDGRELLPCALGTPYGEVNALAHLERVFVSRAPNGETQFFRIDHCVRGTATVRLVRPLGASREG